MRTLLFVVSGQKLTCDPACDFSGIVSNSRGYLRAKFRSSADWNGCKKAAIFAGTGAPIPVPIIGDSCDIPAEALTGNVVQVAVVGQSKTLRIPTNTLEFKQTTGR